MVQEKAVKDTNFLWGPLFADLVNLVIIPQWQKRENYILRQTDMDIYICLHVHGRGCLFRCVCLYI